MGPASVRRLIAAPTRVPVFVVGALALGAMAAAPIAFGAPADGTVLFVVYAVALVAVPGWVAYLALASQPGGALRQLALAWPIGLVLELIGFNLTAALDVRWLAPGFALAVAAVFLLRASTRTRIAQGVRRARTDALRPATYGHWALLGLFGVFLVYLMLGFYALTPLPGSVDSVVYHPDAVFHLAVAAEAANHWPIEHPSVAGESFRYHTFANMHMAAVQQVIGGDLATIAFRFTLLVPLGVILLQIAEIGRTTFGAARYGVVAVAVIVMVGELDLDPDRANLFFNLFLQDLWLSPSFLMGAPLFLGALALLVVHGANLRDATKGDLLLLTALLFGVSGAKGTFLPVLLFGSIIAAAWGVAATRRIPRERLRLPLLCGGVLLVSYLALYIGGAPSGFTLDPLQFVEYAVFDEVLSPDVLQSPGGRLVVGGAQYIGLLLPLAGILAYVLLGRKFSSAARLLLSILVSSLLIASILGHPGGSQNYFLYAGILSGAVVSAGGFVAVYDKMREAGRLIPFVLAGVLFSAVALGFGLAIDAGLAPQPISVDLLFAAYGALALAAVVAAWGLARRVGSFPATWLAVGAVLVALMGVADAPLDQVLPRVKKARAGVPTHTVPYPEYKGLNNGLLEGLRWIRDNSEEDDLIAVNNHYISTGVSRYYYYSAFSERRAFLEGWDYVTHGSWLSSRPRGHPFPEKLSLSRGLFRANPEAIRQMRDDEGVRFAIFDRINGQGIDHLGGSHDPVFENDAVAVYEL